MGTTGDFLCGTPHGIQVDSLTQGFTINVQESTQLKRSRSDELSRFVEQTNSRYRSLTLIAVSLGSGLIVSSHAHSYSSKAVQKAANATRTSGEEITYVLEGTLKYMIVYKKGERKCQI